ncbi:MAG: MBL fold metallo-hydrolase RNA specificity domain-containing protein, partial [Methanoregula sp.]
SANVIPNPMNYGQRYMIEARLGLSGVRIFEDLHVSGHAYREDHYELLHILNPQHIVPAHGSMKMTAGYTQFASELGYTPHSTVHQMGNGQRVRIN